MLLAGWIFFCCWVEILLLNWVCLIFCWCVGDGEPCSFKLILTFKYFMKSCCSFRVYTDQFWYILMIFVSLDVLLYNYNSFETEWQLILGKFMTGFQQDGYHASFHKQDFWHDLKSSAQKHWNRNRSWTSSQEERHTYKLGSRFRWWSRTDPFLDEKAGFTPTFKGTDPIGLLALTDKLFAVQKVEPSKLKAGWRGGRNTVRIRASWRRKRRNHRWDFLLSKIMKL